MKDLYRSLRMLRDHERGIKPDAAWVSVTRERLLMQVSNSIPTREAAARNRRVLAQAYPNFFSILRGPVLATLSIVGIIFGGSFASVRAAERSLPGDMLYTVKLVTEQTRLAFERSKTEKVKLKVGFTRRRAEELKTVAQADSSNRSERISIAADLLKQDFNTLKEQLADARQTVGDSIDSQDIRNVIEIVKAVDKNVVETVQVIKDANTEDLPADVKQKMVDAEAQAADAGVHVLEVLVMATTNQNSEVGLVTTEDITASVQAHAVVAQDALTQAISIASSTSATLVETSAQTGIANTASTTTVSGSMASAAAVTLGEVQVLVQENKIAEAIDKLKEASTKSYLAQSEAQKESDVAIDAASAVSSTVAVIAEGSSSSTTNNTDPSESLTATSTNQQTTGTSP
jgi:hypothetical protein